MGHPRPRTPAMACPHCQSKAIVRSSQEVTPTYRTLHYRCENDACGHAFVAQLSILHSVRASAVPNPAINLPLRLATAVKAIAPLGRLGPAVGLPALMEKLDALPSV